jgi:hypothetical protein
MTLLRLLKLTTTAVIAAATLVARGAALGLAVPTARSIRLGSLQIARRGVVLA